MPRAVAGSTANMQEEIEGGRCVVREMWVADAHGITSLPAGRVTAADLRALVRGHWLVEVNHWIRDVVWREDH